MNSTRRTLGGLRALFLQPSRLAGVPPSLCKLRSVPYNCQKIVFSSPSQFFLYQNLATLFPHLVTFPPLPTLLSLPFPPSPSPLPPFSPPSLLFLTSPPIFALPPPSHFLFLSASLFLSDAADKVVQGSGKFEELVVSSHDIAASTAQLVAASRVKARPKSEKLKGLKASSRAGGGYSHNVTMASSNTLRGHVSLTCILWHTSC